MNRAELRWTRFESFLKAQDALRAEFVFKGRRLKAGTPSVYLLTDRDEQAVLRVGQTGLGLLEEYKTGVRYLIEAAMHRSGNRVFVAEAPENKDQREDIERTLIKTYDPLFNPERREPRSQVVIEHLGDVPRRFKAESRR